MTESSPSTTTPAEMLRSEFESRLGWTLDGVPDDLTWDQATGLAQSIFREYTRHYTPEVAARLDVGDVNGAARAFMDHLEAQR